MTFSSLSSLKGRAAHACLKPAPSPGLHPNANTRCTLWVADVMVRHLQSHGSAVGERHLPSGRKYGKERAALRSWTGTQGPLEQSSCLRTLSGQAGAAVDASRYNADSVGIAV